MIWGGSPAQGIVVGTIDTATSLTADMAVPAAFGSTVRRDPPAPLEWLAAGASAVTADRLLPLEILDGVRRDWGAGAASARHIIRHFSRPGLVQRVRRLFFGSPALQGSFPIESNALVRDDATAPAEIAARQQADTGPRLELLGLQRTDAGVPLEMTGGIAVAADTVLQLESLVGQLGRSPTLGEFAAALRADIVLGAENLGLQRADFPVLVEDLAASMTVVADATLRLEWTIAVAGDAASPAEAVARAIVDLLIETEHLSIGSVSVAGDVGIPLEVQAALRSGAPLPADWALSVSVATDSLLPIEMGPDTPAPSPARLQVSGIRVRLLRRD